MSRVAIVTGAGTGIGAAAARLPAERDLKVDAAARAVFCSAIADCED